MVPPLPAFPGADDLVDIAARLEGLKQQMAERSAKGNWEERRRTIQEGRHGAALLHPERCVPGSFARQAAVTGRLGNAIWPVRR